MTRITETKSVKVDNWGVFFLQKLQNFFNKTDHCDLTLQFNDNSQLKVHRLVLSACTDYFNMLENTCEMYDDVLIMPLDLQADVIVPIVNFMYTGTLEFQYNMYDKLLKTARDMNMTVLLKLLEAHKQTTRYAQNNRPQPVVLNKQAPRGRPVGNVAYQTSSTVGRNFGTYRQPVRTAVPQKGPTIVKPSSSGYTANKSLSISEPHSLVAKYASAGDNRAGPSRFEESASGETLEGAFDSISYESKPLVTADQIKKEEETSPFEKLRKGYTNVNVTKRPAPASFSTPVAKKPNLEEVKEFTEAARLRSQMATEDDDSPGLADDTQFYEDDDETPAPNQLPIKTSPKSAEPSPKQIVIKQEQKTSPNPVKQITVKDESGNVDHAKIISEVLKKYPHLVKKNKNIKLKIMQKTSPIAQPAAAPAPAPKMEVRTATPLKADLSMVRKATEVIRQPAPSNPPKKIDSKTMHALIAKGAENMTGPWLCLRCGIDGRPISIPSYKAFRNHLIVKHKERIDARICEHCGWKAEQRNPNLFYHWLIEHNIKSTIKFPTCSECDHVAMNVSKLQQHEEDVHPRSELQQCIYCNKVFAKEMDLFEHMKSLHKERAREDGVIDFSDDEYQVGDEEEEEEVAQPNTSQENKIKILSNISITNNAGIPFVIDPTQAQTVSQIGGKSQLQVQQITLEPSSEAEALSNVASGIATSLGLVDNSGVVIEDGNFQGQFIEHQLATVHGETATTTTVTATGPDTLTKLITEDGTELQLTQSQKEEIFSQLQNSENGNVVMVLNDDNFISSAGLQLEDGTIVNAPTTTGADSNIVVMYSQAGDDLTNTHTTVTTVTSSAPAGAQTVVAQEPSESAQASKNETLDEELSQASTQPSEKASEKDSVAEPMEEDPDSSQQSNKDAEKSMDTSDQPAPESDEEDPDESKEKEKVEKEKEKQKLISELEGDWSEDTEEQQPVEEKEVQKAAAPKSELPQDNKQDSKPVKPKQAANKPKEAKQAEAKPSEAKKPPAASKDENKVNEKDITDLLDEWNNETKFTESDSDADLEKKLEKVVGEKKDDSKVESAMDASTADSTADSVDDSMNDSETQVVIMTAESETEMSLKEDDDGDNKSQEAKHAEEATDSKKTDDSDGDAKETKEEEEKDEEENEEGEDKAKSKEVVNSLLGDWDEDDDM